MLQLQFEVRGNIAGILLPEPAPPRRTDGLWRHTCFEAFVIADEETGYVEANLSPSGEWAAYRFTGYRAGMAPAPLAAPAIRRVTGANRLKISTELLLGDLLPPALKWRIGLSAVIEGRGGEISYWALQHAEGAPDFHAAACFALELGPAA